MVDHDQYDVILRPHGKGPGAEQGGVLKIERDSAFRSEIFSQGRVAGWPIGDVGLHHRLHVDDRLAGVGDDARAHGLVALREAPEGFDQRRTVQRAA